MTGRVFSIRPFYKAILQVATYILKRKTLWACELKGFFRQVFYDKYQYIPQIPDPDRYPAVNVDAEHLLVRKNAYRGILVSVCCEAGQVRFTTKTVVPARLLRWVQQYLGGAGSLLLSVMFGSIAELQADVDHLLSHHVFADRLDLNEI
jgi:hypothetical protein